MTTLTLGAGTWAARQRLTAAWRWWRGSWFPWRRWTRPNGRHHAPAAALTPSVFDAVLPRAVVAGRPPWDDAPRPARWVPVRPGALIAVRDRPDDACGMSPCWLH